jgi:hypothetical protein
MFEVSGRCAGNACLYLRRNELACVGLNGNGIDKFDFLPCNVGSQAAFEAFVLEGGSGFFIFTGSKNEEKYKAKGTQYCKS